MAVSLHFEGHPSHKLDLPSFHAADITERVKLIRTLTLRAYHMMHIYGGNTIGLSGMSGKDGRAVIQNLKNELKKLGALTALQQVVTGGQAVEVQEVSFLARTADGLGRWAQGTARRFKHFEANKPGLFLGLDIGSEKIKTYIMKDGKGLFKGMFSSGVGQDGEPTDKLDIGSLGRGIQEAAKKTVTIGSRSLGGQEPKLDGLVVIVSRQARRELLPEPKWMLQGLYTKYECPIWLHSDREAQALACAVIFGAENICAASLGRSYSLGLLRDGIPLSGPMGAEYFWEDTSKDCYQGSSLAFLNAQAELAIAQRKGFKSAIDRLDTTEINQAAAAKSHPMHYRAYEVIRDLAKHLLWNLTELHSFCPFEIAAITGARSAQVGNALVSEMTTALERLEGGPRFTIRTVEEKMNPVLTGAYGAALLASAQTQKIAVGGLPQKAFG